MLQKNPERWEKPQRNQDLPRGVFLTFIVFVVVVGSLALAVVDEASRPAFIDLSKVIFAGYLGWMIPK